MTPLLDHCPVSEEKGHAALDMQSCASTVSLYLCCVRSHLGEEPVTGRGSMDTRLGASGPRAVAAPTSSSPPTWEAVATTSAAASYASRFVARQRHGAPLCL
jgi:hypothetical protein